MESIVFILLIGIGATLVMDLWALLRKQLFGIAPTNWGMVGRWIGPVSYTHLTLPTKVEG